MRRIERNISILLLAGMMGLVAAPGIGSAYGDEIQEGPGCNVCQCEVPNNPQGSQYGRIVDGDCIPCENCHIQIE